MAADKIIPAGYVINWRGQRYQLTGQRARFTKEAVFTRLLVWRADCAKCGEPFTYEVSIGREFGPPLRRCPVCRRGKRGVRVNLHGGFSERDWVADAVRAIEMTRRVKW